MNKYIQVVFILSLSLVTEVASADLAADLRSLSGTVSEMTSTSKELGVISNAATEQSNQSQTSQINLQTAGELQAGDVLISKINKIKLFKEPSKKSDKSGILTRGDEMIYVGEQANGFYKISANNGEGWVEKILVKKAN